LNKEGKMKDMTGQRKSLRTGNVKDGKDEKREYAEGEMVEGGGGDKQKWKATHNV
jgi:hypothetical protein